MNYNLTIFDIKPYSTEVVAQLDDNEVIRRGRMMIPVETQQYFEQHNDVVSEIHSAQYYARSMMLALIDLEFDWKLETHHMERPAKGFKTFNLLNEYPYLDDDFLHGEHGIACVEDEIPTIEVEVDIQYNPTLKLIINQNMIERYHGNMSLLCRDLICEYLPTNVKVCGL